MITGAGIARPFYDSGVAHQFNGDYLVFETVFEHRFAPGFPGSPGVGSERSSSIRASTTVTTRREASGGYSQWV
ncbi:hypothetical protein O1W68_12855 [Rhodococcus sp. H36-A4]|uniref:hypothetical protein n=1 Tax=Rhodococcus sp. H36-A4 TaxID=3004353 RepID=UPI0022AE95D0|nr:hypothetical protein [Rhodococcus sp. H36-A4]MCZ4078838.1 hypothetical protein [Rhodococcus sp. H36-A4]